MAHGMLRLHPCRCCWSLHSARSSHRPTKGSTPGSSPPRRGRGCGVWTFGCWIRRRLQRCGGARSLDGSRPNERLILGDGQSCLQLLDLRITLSHGNFEPCDLRVLVHFLAVRPLLFQIVILRKRLCERLRGSTCSFHKFADARELCCAPAICALAGSTTHDCGPPRNIARLGGASCATFDRHDTTPIVLLQCCQQPLLSEI
mmetsp:Transcript_45656/g.130844  ORF Transcript_45656/g.130844 Transcript_45656/m.130844 type:complete len:202 (+) Transcript_45656:1436-2041(+)